MINVYVPIQIKQHIIIRRYLRVNNEKIKRSLKGEQDRILLVYLLLILFCNRIVSV